MVSPFFRLAPAIIFSLAANMLLLPVNQAKAVGAAADGLSRADIIGKLQVNPREVFSNAEGKLSNLSELSSSVRYLNNAALKPIIGRLLLAAPAEKSAIRTGLEQAAMVIIKIDPAYAAEIQEALAAMNDQVVIVALAAVTGNGGTGGRGGGGGGLAIGGNSKPLVVDAASLTLKMATTSTTATTTITVTNSLTSVSP